MPSGIITTYLISRMVVRRGFTHECPARKSSKFPLDYFDFLGLRCGRPKPVLFEAIQGALSGMQILNDLAMAQYGDFGQGGVLGRRSTEPLSTCIQDSRNLR